MPEVQFLFNTDLVAELVNLIKNADRKLILISPFIDLSQEVKSALDEHKSKHDFELIVLFGKNENNIYKSLKKDSFEFLKTFPNVDIRYNERLHAKFYQNDFDYIMTSLNLYDYSLAKNIEVGIKFNYSSKSVLGKVLNGTNNILIQGVDKIEEKVLGIGNKEIDPILEFEKIFANSEKKYKTEPIKIEKDDITGLFGAKKLHGFKVLYDNLAINSQNLKEYKTKLNSNESIKTLSASQLSKKIGVSTFDINNLMQNKGLINGDNITKLGESKGIIMKQYMGKNYISYPENIEELNALKKN